MQCYEGLDIAQTAYEWNVARQMIEIRLAEAAHSIHGEGDRERLTHSLYSRSMLIERPLLQALTQARSPVLLIDELDRADEPFDAFLLEVLAENQLTIPEFGTVKAGDGGADHHHHQQPHARDPRCAEAPLPVPLGRFPDVERELEIVRLKAPGAADRLYVQVVEFVQRMRTLDLFKAPGVAETIDWTNALVALNAIRLDPATVHDTLGVLLKYQDDIAEAACRRRCACSTEAARPGRAAVIAENIVHFARVLRDAGMPVGPDRVLAATAALNRRHRAAR